MSISQSLRTYFVIVRPYTWFMQELRCRGLGFLRAEGVRKKLAEMSQSRKERKRFWFW